jgi:hypothetical protein
VIRVGSVGAAVSMSFPLEDARPESGVPLPAVIDMLADRYNFRVRPQPLRGFTFALPTSLTASVPATAPMSAGVSATSPISVPAAGFPVATSFRNGTFSKAEHQIAVNQLDLSIDSDPGNIVVHATTTAAAEEVLDDITEVLGTAFSLRNLRQVATKVYLSNVVVIFERSIEQRIKELGLIQSIVNSALASKVGVSFGFERLSFGADLTTVPISRAHSVHGFVLERRANHPFSENRYFSSAPLKTDEHFAVLEKISAVIEGK